MRNQHFTTLVIDDDDLDRRAVRRALGRISPSIVVLEAEDGVEGLRVLRSAETKDVVVVLDLRMPLMGGLEFLDELRADPAIARTSVIVFSTSDLESDQRAAYERGAIAYVEKSDPGVHDDLARLLSAIQRTVTLPH